MRAVSAVLFVAFAGMCLGCGGPSGQGAVAKKVWTEAELSAAVKGRTYQEVTALLGPPTTTGGDPEMKPRVTFWYDKIIRDVNNGKITNANIIIVNQRATGEVR